MDAFSLLKRPLREYIYASGWQALRPIQKRAITFSQESDNNFILAAPTASGKTEAAFLPAINQVDDWTNGVKILYISPLIALINDQFKRLVQLCQDLGINVTSWHGEANQAKKKELIKHPNGIVLITPESIEAMLVNRPQQARHLFGQTEWIIIDEIHSFLGENRGIQVMSLLNRLGFYMQKDPRCVGLSATLDKEDYFTAKLFFQNKRETSVIVDRGQNERMHEIFYFPKQKSDESSFFKGIDVIYAAAQTESMLVFPNSRNKVEEIGSSLNRRAEKNKQNQASFFVHHASLPKDTRLFAEQFAKESRGRKFTICCTSTLELGIDIGAVDSIIQYGPPPNVSTLSQRLGRSGRRTGVNKLRFIAHEAWELLQGIASIQLLDEGQLDTSPQITQPFDVLAHQIISLVIEHNGLTKEALHQHLRRGHVWRAIKDEHLDYLIDSMVEREYLELMDNYEMISGYNAQPLLRMAEFYTQFSTEPELSVYHDLKNIGTIAIEPGLTNGDNILLSGKVWQILWIDLPKKQVHVIPANKGEAYFESKDRQDVSSLVRERMKQILLTGDWMHYEPLIQESFDNLAGSIMKKDGYYFQLTDNGDPWLVSFLGSKANRTLVYLLGLVTGRVYKQGVTSVFIVGDHIRESLIEAREANVSRDDWIHFFKHNDLILQSEIAHLKYHKLVPKDLMIEYVIDEALAIDEVNAFLQGDSFIA
ncbi:DEAD/DEAH box helicase [Fundicoccus culcitae]|uniref:DEAD/DEAH box helicase n=1 Tax=Fundicoccus culcitae TaxID=2969821 RepID=A0ABY5P7G9_9LACT|nr:DEAD/DEAH box helicase [Fundicoccus culcitae]UUX34677.1 DEAD/DEAH box helicase [Fundicoccus culcitae]